MERTFALYSPNVDSIKIVRSGKVRRAKLYYLRDRKGKSARIAEKIKKKIGVDVSLKTNEVKIEKVNFKNPDKKASETKLESESSETEVKKVSEEKK